MRSRILLAALSPTLLLAACNMAPEYAPPLLDMPAQFKEEGMWREARPSDNLPRGEWWRSLNDRTLNELEPQVEAANQNLASSLAVIDQARAFAAKAQAGLFPTIRLNNSYSANKESAHRPTRKADTPPSLQGYAESFLTHRPLNEPDHFGNNILDLQATYEVDLWGRVRNAVESGQAQLQASEADLESIKLSLQAELARDYIALRGLDSEAKLLTDTIETYRRALVLTQTLVTGQIASPADASRADAQLQTARAQLDDLMARRALYEHAIATLIGRPASSFSIPPAPAALSVPNYPHGVPLTLLERRPDIAAAERRVAAANQLIGVARAAFFPRLTINLSGGTQDTGLNLLSLKNSVWSVGPAITLPIFDGGLRRADLAGAEASYLETVANYRETVLRAIQEVEDSLAVQRWLAKAAASSSAASASSRKVLDISLSLYREGATTYLDVVSAQTAALDAKRAVLAFTTRRLQASVTLMMALGGGWFSADLLSDAEHS